MALTGGRHSVPPVAVDYYLISASRRAHKLRPPKTYVFGREDTCDIPLTDALVSRKHAELRWDQQQGWYIVDLNSRNGVLVNGVRLTQPTRLEDGTVVQIGGQVLRLHHLPPGADPAQLSQQAPQISTVETLAPGFSLNQLMDQGATFSGTVSGPLLDLIQYFTSNAKTGRLDLTNGADGGVGSLWLAAGAPVHATGRGQTGFDALLALAKEPPPRFAFFADAPPPGERTLQGTASALLMDVARVLDEGRR